MPRAGEDAISVLFEVSHASRDVLSGSDVAHDLHLDDIVAAITAGREEYDLGPLFADAVDDVGTVVYRQEVFRDLDARPALAVIEEFAGRMRVVRRYLAATRDKRRVLRDRQRWFLDAALAYCEAVGWFAEQLGEIELRSRALRAFRSALNDHVHSAGFRAVADDAAATRAALDGIRYAINVSGDTVRVSRYRDEPDLSAEVLATFAKFRQGDVKTPSWRTTEAAGLDRVGGQILDLVARLFPEPFAMLDACCADHPGFAAAFVVRFDREVELYVSYLHYVDRFRSAGLRFCYPEVSDMAKEVDVADTFDLALARRLLDDGVEVVTNSFGLHGGERIFVVTGPNQGGKTTLARTFGQVHYFGRLGCPVPGSSATLVFYDQLFTLFEREEDLANESGKLQDDLLRMRGIFESATAQSIVVLNEMFTSTSLHDSRVLGARVIRELVERQVLAVYVTFVDELASLDRSIVSMVSTVAPDDPTRRTFQVIRKPADGLAYAVAIAEKYGLTYQTLTRRLAS